MNQKGFIIPLLAIILIIAAGIGGYVLVQQKRIEALNSKIRLGTTNIDLQEKCAKQAEKAYRDSESKVMAMDGSLSNFNNHYNSKLNKCFVRIDKDPYHAGEFSHYEFLYDAYEGKLYAEYGKYSEKDAKPFVCTILEKSCQSREEFDAFIKTYMED